MIKMKNEAQSARVRVLYASVAAALLGACTQTAPAPTATTVSAHSSGSSSDMQEVVVTASRDEPVSRR
jgi:outer membrane biogenesis lipoprotein LolB